MRVKTFEAASMQEALSIIKQEMGEEAFILSTKTRARKNALGQPEASVIEVTAAVDEAPVPAPPLPVNGGTYGLRPPLAERRPEPPAPRPAPPPPAGPVDLQPLRRELLEIKGAVEALKEQEARNGFILKELDHLKNLLSRIQRQGMPAAQIQLPPTLIELYGDLVANDVDPLIALRLCEYTQRALTEEAGPDTLDPERARLQLDGRGHGDEVGDDPPHEEPGRMRVAALVGPTGVGKTTTIAKLAAYAKIELKQKVALLTLDTFRLAAVDQLQQYAQILQVPIHVALTVEDLRSALRFYQDRALVLIDTPGHNPKDTEVLDQLRHLLAELPDVETHLVLSATTKPKDLADLVHRFEPLNPTRLIFTKLDETSTYGPILSTLARVRRPLSYLGTGQEVPQDLELATSRRVSDLILPVPAEVA